MASRIGLLALSLGILAACSGKGSGSTDASGTGGTGGTGGGGSASGGHGGGGAGPGSTSSSSGKASSSTTSSTGPSGSTSSGASTSSGGVTDAGTPDGADGGDFDCSVLGVPGNCMDTSDCSAIPGHAPQSGFCPGAANIECCVPYGTLLCDPATMPEPDPNADDTEEAAGEGDCLPGMVAVSTFCIDKYEATLVRADDGTAWSPYFNPGDTPMRAISVAGAVPQGYIDQIQAGEACTNAGKRLCSDTEWLRACQGPAMTTYPYGNTKELGVCNDHRALHPAVEYFGTTDSVIYTELDNACINQLPESVDLTGAETGCVTAEGAFDMMGNVHEWTANPAGTFRGGYYVDTVQNGPGCEYATTAHDTSYWDYSTGFRCCAD